jgi:hypothetical protein
VVQNQDADAALEERQQVPLLDVGNGPRHVVEQDGVEIGSNGTIIDGASVGRLMRARFRFLFRSILEDGPETRVKIIAACDN